MMKILIADDHELFLQGLKFVLESHFKDSQITAVKDYTGLLSEVERKSFDLIITDLAMPGANFMEALTKVHSILKDTPIIVISAVFGKQIVQKTFEIGVSGYIPKSSSNDLLLSAIHLVLAGGLYIPKDLLEEATVSPEMQSLKDLSAIQNTNDEDRKLTNRQIDVLRCLAKGMQNKIIAYELGLTEGTVKVHITVLLKALGVSNRTAAIMEAVKRGYISQNEVGL